MKELLKNKNFLQKTIPVIKPEYFESRADKIVFETIYTFYEKYSDVPTVDALVVDINKAKIQDDLFTDVMNLLSEIKDTLHDPVNEDWIVDKTEEFCQERAIYNALVDSVGIMSGDTQFDRHMIIDLVQDALAVGFDAELGHDYLEHWQERYRKYHTKEERLEFDISILNKITNGGVPKKTLNIFLAGTNIGKSAMLCHLAAANLKLGKNVLYITLEMSEDETAKRIDANLFDLEIDQVTKISRDEYQNKIAKIKNKTTGKLKIKEYPTSCAHVGHIRQYINELKLREDFIPDVIYIDYLNIMLSSRFKNQGMNMYGYIKTISEEVRGLAVQMEVPIWSATQFNRQGFTSSDPDIEDVSESFGLTFTADFILGLIAMKDLTDQDAILCKQLKSRYGDKNKNNRFVLGFNRAKQQFYEMEFDEHGNNESVENNPVFDNGGFSTSERDRTKGRNFKGFQFQ